MENAIAARLGLDWFVCPVCGAGSPAGASVCPRCRYRFRHAIAVLAPEVDVRSSDRSTRTRRRRLGQFALFWCMIAMAPFGVVLAWPRSIVALVVGGIVYVLHRVCEDWWAFGVLLVVILPFIGLVVWGLGRAPAW
jgi:ribosomal protein L40E